MAGNERGLGDEVVSCSRTPHGETVVGGRAQMKLPRYLVPKMRLKKRRCSFNVRNKSTSLCLTVLSKGWICSQSPRGS